MVLGPLLAEWDVMFGSWGTKVTTAPFTLHLGWRTENMGFNVGWFKQSIFFVFLKLKWFAFLLLYSRPKVTLHFSFLNISILVQILIKWNIAISFQHFSMHNS